MRIATVALSLIGCTMGVAASARPISQDEQLAGLRTMPTHDDATIDAI